MDKKVLVSGCFDLLHAGHVTFFKTVSSYGKLYVGLGRDENLLLLKGKAPYFSQEERAYMVNAIKYVEEAFLCSGSGMLDFEPDLKRIRPDFFVVNSDGHTREKESLCKENGVEYVVLERIPDEELPARSSSDTKRDLRFPFRVCIAGGWLDQPWVSKIYPGPVIVAQIRPTIDFNDRSGMATSSRRIAIEIWGDRYPDGDPIRNAKLLFGAENPPNVEYVSGSQDQIGLLAPGINRLNYDGGYWPSKIDSVVDPDICDWLSRVMHLIPLEPRPEGYNPLESKDLGKAHVIRLSEGAELCWQGIIHKDVERFGKGMTETFMAWSQMLPYTVPDWVMQKMQDEIYPNYPGAISSGSGGGYIVVGSEEEIEGAIKVKVRY